MIDAWTGPPPTPQQFPGRPSDGLDQLIGMVKDQGARQREATSNLFRTAGLRVMPNKIASTDFDGTDRAHLGTAGWMLGSDGPGLPSYLALNGVDVIADMAAKTADLAARVTVTNSIATFNTGSLPTDWIRRAYGASIPITVAVPTGRLVISVGCGMAVLAAGSGNGGNVAAYATFSIPGVANALDYYGSAWLGGAVTGIGTAAPLSVSRAFTVPPGIYTITGQMYARGDSASANVNFEQPWLTVQVTG